MAPVFQCHENPLSAFNGSSFIDRLVNKLGNGNEYVDVMI